jgi:hypothetical protein
MRKKGRASDHALSPDYDHAALLRHAAAALPDNNLNDMSYSVGAERLSGLNAAPVDERGHSLLS